MKKILMALLMSGFGYLAAATAETTAGGPGDGDEKAKNLVQRGVVVHTGDDAAIAAALAPAPAPAPVPLKVINTADWSLSLEAGNELATSLNTGKVYKLTSIESSLPFLEIPANAEANKRYPILCSHIVKMQDGIRTLAPLTLKEQIGELQLVSEEILREPETICWFTTGMAGKHYYRYHAIPIIVREHVTIKVGEAETTFDATTLKTHQFTQCHIGPQNPGSQKDMHYMDGNPPPTVPFLMRPSVRDLIVTAFEANKGLLAEKL